MKTFFGMLTLLFFLSSCGEKNIKNSDSTVEQIKIRPYSFTYCVHSESGDQSCLEPSRFTKRYFTLPGCIKEEDKCVANPRCRVYKSCKE